jgi:hypothetical protein
MVRIRTDETNGERARCLFERLLPLHPMEVIAGRQEHHPFHHWRKEKEREPNTSLFAEWESG